MNYYYSNTITDFIVESENDVIAKLIINSGSDVDLTQHDAWKFEINTLKEQLQKFSGEIYFEFVVPRIGRRIDVILQIKGVLFVLEFKVQKKSIDHSAIDQAWDYALDLHHFHETSHNACIAPIVITPAKVRNSKYRSIIVQDGNILHPLVYGHNEISDILDLILEKCGSSQISNWKEGRYKPSPTIIEAAKSLYKNHSVDDITTHEASAINLAKTSKTVLDIINYSNTHSQKSICFVTGVPGSGKTLVGLDIAGKRLAQQNENRSVFLSGNGPLVSVLCEALVQDKWLECKKQKIKRTKKEIHREVSKIIQNVHHYRDTYLKDLNPPFDHVAIFDEAQRAWDLNQTKNFMARRKRIPNFSQSEPEFLISCLDRHQDWAVIVCLVGNGQEINTGEAGISEWLRAIKKNHPEWYIYLPSQLSSYEKDVKPIVADSELAHRIQYSDDLHLSVSMRAIRSEKLSLLVNQLLDRNSISANQSLQSINDNFSLVITRDLKKAKEWLKSKARGTERYGIVVSSQAERLKPHAIDVRTPINPIHWFLKDKDDIRSSLFLEDVATEFHVQGLELDWVCVTWDADFRYDPNKWGAHSFRGNKWMTIRKQQRMIYQINAYRVLLTRARKGMVIVVPDGDDDDHTRKREYYDPTFSFLKSIGFNTI